jgi:hypothetical protein
VRGEPNGDHRSTGSVVGRARRADSAGHRNARSGNLRWFDTALVGYLFGILFAVFAVVYGYLVWFGTRLPAQQAPPATCRSGSSTSRAST